MGQIMERVVMERTATVIEAGAANDRPCQEWHDGHAGGSIPHQPIPFAAIGDTVEVGCDRCEAYLYTYQLVMMEVIA